MIAADLYLLLFAGIVGIPLGALSCRNAETRAARRRHPSGGGRS